MLYLAARNWWTFAVRGVVAILFGLAALLWPGLTLTTLVLVFGVYVLVDGIGAVIAGIAAHGRAERGWVLVLEGIVGIIVGVIAIISPATIELALLYLIAAWALIKGVLEIVQAIQFRQVLTGEGFIILGGILSILFGLILVIFPGSGALGLLWVIAIYAILFGIFLLILAFRLRGLRSRLEPSSPSPA